MNATENKSSTEENGGEFCCLLCKELDERYAAFPVLPARPEYEPEPDYHNNPPID